VVAEMFAIPKLKTQLWNRFTPYLNDVRFGVDEEPMSVWPIKSVGLLQILAIDVLI
jgi:hypothetical protein